MQLEELVGKVPADLDAIVRDYHAVSADAEATLTVEGLRAMSYRDLREFERLAEILGYERGVNPLDRSVAPRGFRVLSHIPRLPEAVIRRVVSDLGSLDTVVRASQRDLEAVPLGPWGPVRT